ncbi:hypothetical protein CMK14_25540 [Candidatus Poribacteria bacterium]|nr:hypothetical protein [Candidatus Poribacteria bacterium]
MKWSQLWLLISILLGYSLSAMMKLIKVRYWSLGSMIEQKLDGRIAEKILPGLQKRLVKRRFLLSVG